MREHTSLYTRILRNFEETRRISDQLTMSGPSLITTLCEKHSLREVARKTKLSPTYLSEVRRRKTIISPGAYLKLVNFADSQS